MANFKGRKARRTVKSFSGKKLHPNCRYERKMASEHNGIYLRRHTFDPELLIAQT